MNKINEKQFKEIVKNAAETHTARNIKLATAAIGAGSGVATCAMIGNAGLVILGGGICLSYGAFAIAGGVIALGIRGLFK